MTIAKPKDLVGNRLRMAAVGDVMLADQHSCFGFGIRSQYDGVGYDRLLIDASLRDLLQRAHVTIGNMECSYNDRLPLRFGEHVMAVNSKAVEYLGTLGFNVMNLANNHMLEHGPDALNAMQAALIRQKIAYCGLGEPLRCVFGDKTLSFLGYTAVPDYKNMDYIAIWRQSELERVRAEADTGAFVVVSMHWGNEFIPMPSPAQVDLGHALVDAGARLILGSHPHVLQPVERYGDALIIYSMGNFFFDNFFSSCGDSAVFTFDIDLKTRSLEYTAFPVISSTHDFRVCSATDKAAESILRHLEAPLEALDTVAYNSRAVMFRREYRRRVFLHFARNVFRYRDKLSMFRWASRRLRLIWRNRHAEVKNPSEVYRWK